jgi:hypothetical protein
VELERAGRWEIKERGKAEEKQKESRGKAEEKQRKSRGKAKKSKEKARKKKPEKTREIGETRETRENKGLICCACVRVCLIVNRSIFPKPRLPPKNLGRFGNSADPFFEIDLETARIKERRRQRKLDKPDKSEKSEKSEKPEIVKKPKGCSRCACVRACSIVSKVAFSQSRVSPPKIQRNQTN